MSTPFPLQRGQVLHIPGTGPTSDPNKPHFHVVVTNQSVEGTFLLVPICSKRIGTDHTCLLGVGDHPVINRDSYIGYHHADEWRAAVVEARIKSGDITIRGPINDRLFARICAGVEVSMHTSPKMKKYYKDNSSA